MLAALGLQEGDGSLFRQPPLGSPSAISPRNDSRSPCAIEQVRMAAVTTNERTNR
jgi:hypothetical protein